MLSATPGASLTLPSCSPNYPRASPIGWTHARRCPLLKCFRVFISFSAKSCKVSDLMKKTVKLIDLAKPSNFLHKLPCFRFYQVFSKKFQKVSDFVKSRENFMNLTKRKVEFSKRTLEWMNSTKRKLDSFDVKTPQKAIAQKYKLEFSKTHVWTL